MDSDDLQKFVSTFPKNFLLIIFPPYHHGHAINRIMCSHPEYYWDALTCNMPYEDIEHCTSSLVWPERVDHYEEDRAGTFTGTTRKQDLLITYRRVHGGQYLDKQQVEENARFLKQKSEAHPDIWHTALNHALPNWIDGQASVLLNNPKLVITSCKEGFQEMRQYVKGYLDDIELKDVAGFESKIIERCKSEKPEIIEAIQSAGKLEDDKEKLLVEVITKLKETFKS